MRIGVTVETGARSEDLLIECDDTTTVEELERSLQRHVGRVVSIPGRRGAVAARTLVHGARLGNGGRRRSVLRSRWQLHVVSGPDSGVVWSLDQGDHVVGRSGGICWNDPAMSRRHVSVHVGAMVALTDLESTHGSRLDGRQCLPGVQVEWPVDATLEIGDSVAVLRDTPAADGSWEEGAPGWRRLLRPPRLRTPTEVPVIEIPDPPPVPETRRLPAVALAMPLVVGVGIALALRRPEYLLFAAVSPLMVLTNHVVARIGAARRGAASAAAHAAQVADAEHQLARALEAEQNQLREEQPDAAEVLLTALLPRRRLWERRPSDPDFLRLRIGSGDQPARVLVRGGEHEEPMVRGVPQSVDLAGEGVVGITGDEAVTDGVLRWAVAQLATHQAPRDLSLMFLGVDVDEDWRWLHWLPHLRPRMAEVWQPAIGTDRASIRSQVAALRDLIDRRRASGEASPEAAAVRVVVVVRGSAEVARIADLREIVEAGPSVGVHILCTGRSDSELPEQARVVVSSLPPRAARGCLRGDGRHLESILLEQVSARWAERFARALAPFQDAPTARGSAVPDGVHLLELLKGQPSPGDISARWRSDPRTTEVVLGAGVQGPLSLDLKADGPHALLAGTTGSGKTELLQTLIMSLALGNHPRSLNFVLIDYKGDSAFQECARLPHAVGKVTDLDPALVQRALISLRAELERRKAVLAGAGVSDVDGFYELTLREPDRIPLPYLVLVIDEFAELTKELPEFIDGLVTIAQLGRSLGVHVVLATQRPSGVLSPAIRANTNIRIALRVADPADSVDILGVADASLIPADRPGRGYLRLGAQQPTEFQAARVAAPRWSPRDEPSPEPLIAPLSWSDPRLAAGSTAGVDVGQDLAELVDAIRCAADAADIAPQRRPWLDPLPNRLLWSQREKDPAGSGRLRLPFGVSDVPAQQRQETAYFDLERDGHLYFIGSRASGRSHALRVVAAAIAELWEPADLHLYGLDGGAGALGALTSMPHCGAVVARHEIDRAGRLLTRLIAELDRRLAVAAESQGDASSPRVVLMIDRWEGFVSALGSMGEPVEAVLRLLREGAGVGMHVVITGDRTLMSNTRLSAMTEAKYVLRLTDKADYALAGLSLRQINVDMPPGRCLGPGERETQVFLLDVVPGCRASRRDPRPFRLDPLPDRIGVREAMALLPEGTTAPSVIVGVGGDELSALTLDLGRSSCFAVVGPPGSGRSSVLAAAVESAVLAGVEAIVLASARSPLRHLRAGSGIRDVLMGDAARERVEAVLAQTSGGSLLLVIDDADELRPSPLDDVLLDASRGLLAGVCLIAAGSAEGLGHGFSGWRAELRKARQGLLLSPRSVRDGDVVGATLTRDLVRGPVRPGRGLLVRGGALIPVTALTPSTNCR